MVQSIFLGFEGRNRFTSHSAAHPATPRLDAPDVPLYAFGAGAACAGVVPAGTIYKDYAF